MPSETVIIVVPLRNNSANRFLFPYKLLPYLNLVITPKHINDTMATVKLRFRHSTVAGKEGTLYFRITQGRILRQINTGYIIYADEWDSGTLKLPDTGSRTECRSHLASIRDRVLKDTARINEIIRELDLSGNEYTAAQMVDAYLAAGGNEGGSSASVRSPAVKLKRVGKAGLAETYIKFMQNQGSRFAYFIRR